MKKTIKKTVSWLLSMVLLVGALFNVNVMPVRAEGETPCNVTVNLTVSGGTAADNYNLDCEQLEDGDGHAYQTNNTSISVGKNNLSASDTMNIASHTLKLKYKLQLAGHTLKSISIGDHTLSADEMSALTGSVGYIMDISGSKPTSIAVAMDIAGGGEGGGGGTGGGEGGGPRPEPNTFVSVVQSGFIGAMKIDGSDITLGSTTNRYEGNVPDATSHTFMIQLEVGKATSAITINGVKYTGDTLEVGSEDKYTIRNVPKSENGEYTISFEEAEATVSTIIWTYDVNDPNDPYKETYGEDALVQHGKVEIVSITRNGEAIYANGSVKSGVPNIGVSIGGLRGYVRLEKGDDIVIKLIPDYGYQLDRASINDRALTPKSSAFSDVSTFTLDDVQGQMHFNGVFKPVADSVSSTATSVSGARISNGANAASSGNLSLKVKDAAADSAALSAAMGGDTSGAYSSVATLDLTLDNIVSMGPGKGNWTKNITEFSSDITVGLNLSGVTVGADEELVVVRKHGSTYDVIEGAALNGSTLSVPTNKFSTYSIIKKQKSGGSYDSGDTSSDSSSSSSDSDSSSEPESTKVKVEVSSENAVSIEATVSDGNATIGEISKQSISKLGNDDSVVIDVSSVGSSVKEVTLTKNTFETLTNAVNDATSKISSVEIKLPKATVEIDKAAMNAIKSFTGGKDVKVSVETKSTSSLNTAQKNAIADKKVMATFEANIESGGKKLHDFNGGSITVTVAFKPAAGTDSNYYHVEYVADDGKIERFPTKVTASGVEVTLPHFSSYVIVYDTTKANNTKSTAPRTCSPSFWYMLFRE